MCGWVGILRTCERKEEHRGVPKSLSLSLGRARENDINVEMYPFASRLLGAAAMCRSLERRRLDDDLAEAANVFCGCVLRGSSSSSRPGDDVPAPADSINWGVFLAGLIPKNVRSIRNENINKREEKAHTRKEEAVRSV